MINNVHIGKDHNVCTSYEFAAIMSFLEGRCVSNYEALDHMKRSGYDLEAKEGLNKYYTMDSPDAWNYFKSKYNNMLAKKRISDMERLRYEAFEYVDRYKDMWVW